MILAQSTKIQSSQKPRFSVALQTEGYQKLINNTLQDPKRAQRFIAAISSAVAVNPALQDCDAGSILAGALLGESLNLSPSPQLGQYYLVPFEDKKAGVTKAVFILGYKGYIQLAIRSGQYKKLNVIAIKKGELVKYDAINEEIEVNLIQDEIQRETAPTIGYYAMYEYINGFRKSLYWSRDKMEQHANRHSKAFKLADYKKLQNNEIPQNELWKYSSYWYKDFDIMAFKTMLRQLISNWGLMSIELMNAVESDEAIFNRDGSAEYITGSDINEVNVALQEAVSGQIAPPDEPETQSEFPPPAEAETEQVNIDDL